MQSMNTKDFEIMAPVGSYESLQAAIQAGADSVYFGVEQLNMRAHSANHFTVDDLRDIAATCNDHGMKSYLTVNTIIYGEDLEMMRTIIDAAHEAGITAVIASDIAVMQYCRQVGVEVHLSTQLNISNIEALRFYAQFADVVVLARELRLEQVKDIYRQVQEQNICGPSGQQVRIEMFCHGALCMAVSGKCYMSLDAANRSANRGECIQVCRRSYTATDNETGYQLEIDNKYIMSPKDLKTIRFIDRLMDAGVRVFKIEGRARGPEYVYTVVKCYKEAIQAVVDDQTTADAPAVPTHFTEAQKDAWDERLATVFNRGFWDGYYQGQLMGEWNKNYGSNATERKVYIGKGVKYFSRLGVAEFTVDADTFRLGDKLLVTGPTTGVMYLTATEIHDNDGNPVEEAPQGTRVAIPVTAKVRPSDKLFKIVTAVQTLLALVALVPLLLVSCATKQHLPTPAPEKSIVILYENDVHCGIDGYTKMAGLRDAIAGSDTAFVGTVCCGDFLQGGTSGAISRGQYIVDIMRQMNYNAITLGNHEFDYGVPRMTTLLQTVNAPVVCANFYEAGAQKPYYPAYVIHQFGDKRIAFVGAVTPETMILEAYAFYDNDKMVYDLRPDDFILLVQQAVDEARQAGADYVVLLSHVGEETQSMGFDSHRLIAATKGIDVVLDGHTHSVVPHDEVANKENKIIGITQTGTQFAYVGKLLIKDGRFTTTLIPATEIPYENARVTATTDSVKTLMNETVNRVIGTSPYPLAVTNEDDIYIVRYMETNAGDLVTDAYRAYTKADIALENGGGLRNDVAAGNITYGNVTALSPYDQQVYKIQATGAQIAEALRRSTANVPVPDGNFPQCSGMKYTIHSVSHTISDILVLDSTTGQYVAVDPDQTYTVALSAYYAGGGFYNALKDCPVVAVTTMITRDILTTFIENDLGGELGDTYAKPQGRITIVND